MMSDSHSVDEIHQLTGAYALDALNDIERKHFDRHVASCDACRVEVISLTETASLLGVGVSATPPPELRTSVLTAIARTPQAAPAVPAISAGLGVVRQRSSSVRWLATVAAAAAVIGAVSYGAVQHNRADDMSDQLAVAQSSDAAVSHESMVKMLADPNVKVANTSISGGGTVMSVTSTQEVMLVGAGLKPAEAGKGYQLWEIKGSAPISRGMVTVASDGSFTTKTMDRGGKFAVTIEPATGSQQPTTDPLFVV